MEKSVFIICGKNTELSTQIAKAIEESHIINSQAQPAEQSQEPENGVNPIELFGCNDVAEIIAKIQQNHADESKSLTLICTNINRLTIESWIMIHENQVPELNFIEASVVKSTIK